jgi:hypothetical protein
MDKLRLAVIGLGWSDEIRCDAIVGASNLTKRLMVVTADKSIHTGQVIAI